MSFQEKYFNFIDNLDFPVSVPHKVEILNPFKIEQTCTLSKAFYKKYYSDNNSRLFLIGINPGRFGAGVTGVPFTDPVRLESVCKISNNLDKRQELSSVFVYEMIEAFGGADAFYSKVFFTSVSPLGFVKDGVNLNYYDIPEVRDYLEPYMVSSLRQQITIGAIGKIAFSMGKGQNFKYLQYLNKKYNLFEKVEPLPHPRWIMQYRLKRKMEFIHEYITKIASVF
jgi:uracil-DNA glycosylase